MRIKNAKPKLPTREEGLHRLMLVANKLAKMPKLPTEKSPGFNYDQWGPQFWNGDETLCGSSCCVLGLGTTIPVLRKAGLRMVQCAFPNPNGWSTRLPGTPSNRRKLRSCAGSVRSLAR